MTEFQLNTNAMDDTGFREYIAYEVFNKMGVDTQFYSLGNLKIDDKNIGIITMLEVINESYVSYKYNSNNGNLYKPESIGTALQYKDDEIETYKGIFNNAKTLDTDDEDKKRLISVLKKISEAKTTQEIEQNFINFDNIIKTVAINKTIANVDNFAGRTRRNFFLYEEDGKIDIISYDLNISFGMAPEETAFTQEDVDNIELTEYKNQVHSVVVDLIMENEQYLEKYNLYRKQTLEILEKMQEEEVVEQIHTKVDDIVKNTDNLIFSYEEYKQGVQNLKQFIDERIKLKHNL